MQKVPSKGTPGLPAQRGSLCPSFPQPSARCRRRSPAPGCLQFGDVSKIPVLNLCRLQQGSAFPFPPVPLHIAWVINNHPAPLDTHPAPLSSMQWLHSSPAVTAHCRSNIAKITLKSKLCLTGASLIALTRARPGLREGTQPFLAQAVLA